jgi:hypothetical protein
MAEMKIDIQLAGGRPLQINPAGVLIVVIEHHARIGAVHIAVVVHMDAGYAHREVVAHRNVDEAFDLGGIVVSGLGGDPAFIDIGRLGGDHAEIAAEGVPAIERALRAALDLDAADVEQRNALLLSPALVDAVDVEADDRVVLGAHQAGADAADGGERVRALLAPGQAGRDIFQPARVVDMSARQGLSIHGRYRDRHVLKAFGAPLRGDDDFFDLVGRRRRGCGGLRQNGAAAQAKPG